MKTRKRYLAVAAPAGGLAASPDNDSADSANPFTPSFDIDLLCPRCNSPMKLKSFLTSGKACSACSRVGEDRPTFTPRLAPGPPFFASQVLPQRFVEHSTHCTCYYEDSEPCYEF